MNLLLDEYAYNSVIDEVVYWPPKRIKRVLFQVIPRGVEVVFEDDAKHFTSFEGVDQASALKWWQQAREILILVTNIEVVDSLAPPEKMYCTQLEREVLARRNELIDECLAKYRRFENDAFTNNWLVDQFGFNCSGLTENVRSILTRATKT